MATAQDQSAAEKQLVAAVMMAKDEDIEALRHMRDDHRIILLPEGTIVFVNDPNGTSGFSRSLIREYALKRANEHDKRPIIIENISPTQKITLHGEILLVSLVPLKGYGLFDDRLYFVAKPGHGERKLREGWEQFREKEKAEEEKRKQALDKVAREARGDSVGKGIIGARPAPQ